ncbi:hypothetical protein C8F01DRAFT_514123 [Mycena amicta]|nr:hypothetical protein C8F01DRAFT_514123 [Mycena amicta]
MYSVSTLLPNRQKCFSTRRFFVAINREWSSLSFATMVRRPKVEYHPLDLSSLTKESVTVLQRYLDNGQRLPAVSSKTSYREIWRHTRRFQAVRRTMSPIASRVRAFSRSSKETFSVSVSNLPKNSEERQTFLENQYRIIASLRDGCVRMQQFCDGFEKDSESDLAKLQAEVAKVKVLTNAKERRELLSELTRTVPVARQMKEVFQQHSKELTTIQQELKLFEEGSRDNFRQIWTICETGAASQIAYLA